MIIRRKEINIQYLALQVLNTCPLDQGEDFALGFTAFVERFFLDLDFCSDAFPDREGNFEVDLRVVIDLSLKPLQTKRDILPVDKRINFWKGITAGVRASESTLKFAFEVFTTNLAA